jgi:hypothetical protein
LNSNNLSLPLLLVLTLFTGCGTESGVRQSRETEAQTIESSSIRKAKPVYAVAEFDADRDPQQDLAAAVSQANSDGKRILLEIGGNW